MKTRQIHGHGLGEFLIFDPAKGKLKSAYFFSALRCGRRFLVYADFVYKPNALSSFSIFN